VTVERLTARLTGRVQGVGLRWWVRSTGEKFGLTGWVMNADDERTVELVAEGPSDALDRLEALLHDGPPGARVETVEARRLPASGEYERFGIMRG
jgi:acylphosphatase